MHSIDLTDASWLIRPDAHAARRQAGEPDHHRLRPPRPLPGHQGSDGRGATEGHQRRHRRHHRVGHLGQPRAGVHRHARASRLRQAARASRSICRSPDETRPRWSSPRPGCSPGPAPPTSRFPTTRRRPCWPRSPTSMPGQKLPFGVRPDHRGRARLRRHHRRHRRGSNHPPGRVQTVMTPALITAIAAIAAALGVAAIAGCALQPARRRAARHRRSPPTWTPAIWVCPAPGRPWCTSARCGAGRAPACDGWSIRCAPRCATLPTSRSTWTPIRLRHVNFRCYLCRRRSFSTPTAGSVTGPGGAQGG